MVVCAWNSKNDYKTICGVLLTDVGLHLVCVPELLGCVRFKDYEELFVLFGGKLIGPPTFGPV